MHAIFKTTRKQAAIFLDATHLSKVTMDRLLRRASVFVGAACSFITRVEGVDISSKDQMASSPNASSSSACCAFLLPSFMLPLLNAGGREAVGADDAVRTGSAVSKAIIQKSETMGLLI